MNIQNEIKEFSSFIEEFIEESDRAAVKTGDGSLFDVTPLIIQTIS